MDTVERTARNIAEGMGFDPDLIVIGGHGTQRLNNGPKGSFIVSEKDARAVWELFANDARAAIAAVEIYEDEA